MTKPSHQPWVLVRPDAGQEISAGMFEPLPAENLPQVLPFEATADYPEVIALPERAAKLTKAAPSMWSLARQVLRGLASAGEWLFGWLTLMVGLSALAALPILQFLSLGYLLEAGGRVARTGRFRDGLVGVRLAARAGSIILGTWLMLLPLRFISSLWISAQLIDPAGPMAHTWKVVLLILTGLMVVHILAACSRGGKLRYFFWPFNIFWLMRRCWRGGYYRQARDGVWDFVTALRLPYYFWLGFRGFAGAFLWLAGPVTLLAISINRSQPLVGFLGGVALAIVFLYLPFLQMRFATENRFRAFLEIGKIRQSFRRAPWACVIALFFTLLFALPLYLLKIEIISREAAWLPSLVFVMFMYPTRLLTGWAYGRSLRRATPRHWFFRWTGWLPMFPLAAIFVLIVFFTAYTSWGGIWSLYEQHALLLPVPFVGL
jgi:hypothetical protein